VLASLSAVSYHKRFFMDDVIIQPRILRRTSSGTGRCPAALVTILNKEGLQDITRPVNLNWQKNTEIIGSDLRVIDILIYRLISPPV
jgi:hypothetical protein